MDMSVSGNILTIHIQVAWLLAIVVIVVLLSFLRKR